MNSHFAAVSVVLLLTISASAEVIFERLPSTSGPAYSGYPGGQQVATPFSLAGFAQVDSIDWYGLGTGSGGDFRLTIFQDSSGQPGPSVFTNWVTGVVETATGLAYDWPSNGWSHPVSKFSTQVSTVLAPGRYWLSVTSFMPTSGQFLWERSSAIASGSYAYRIGDTGTWVIPGTSEEFAFALHSLLPVQTNVTVSLCCDEVQVAANGAFTTYVIAQGPTNLVVVNARVSDSSGRALMDFQVQPTNSNGSIRPGVISFAHSNLVAGGSVSLTHIVQGPTGAALGSRTNTILLRRAEPPVTIGLCCTQAMVQANGFVIPLQADRPSARSIRVAGEVRLLSGELLGSPWGSITHGVGAIFFSHPRLTNGAVLTLTHVIDDALGQLGGITTAQLINPPRPVVSFSRAERVIEPWGMVPIEVYFVGNSKAGLPPESPIRVVVRQTSGERRDNLGNLLPLESREIYFWPWQAFQEVSFWELATDATFVLETTGANLGRHSTFRARVGKPAFSVPDFASIGPGRKVNIQVWRMDRQQSAHTVRFQTEDESALGGVDYVPKSGELSFGPGDQFKEFEVEVLPGATPATSFKIRFLDPEASFSYGGMTRVEIPRLISLGASNYWLDAENRLHFTLELNAAADFPVSATIAVPDPWGGGDGGGFIGGGFIGGGCGGHGEFCGRILGTFTIPAGETNATFTLDLSAAEWFSTVFIYNPETMVGERSEARVLPAGWAPDSSLVEVDSPEVPEGHVTKFTLSRGDTTTNALALSYYTIDGTATAGQDYESTRGEITLEAGGVVIIRVPTIVDNVVEETESFGLVVTGASSNIYVRGGTPALISETTPLPFHLSLQSRVTEGESAEFMINASGNDSISFRYFTSDLSARAGVDYESRSGIVNNKTTETVEIPLPDNPHAESGKEFLFTVIAEGPTPFTNSVRVMIQDNEIPDLGEPLLAPGLLYYNEGSPSFGSTFNIPMPIPELVVQRTGDTSQPLTVRAQTRDRTAIAGEDYVPLDVKIEFAPLEVSKVVSVSLVYDTVYEEQEEFGLILTIQGPDGIDVFSRETIFSISNDDPFRGLRMGRSPGGILFLEGIYPDTNLTTAKIEASEDMVTWDVAAQYRVSQFRNIQMAVPDENRYRFYRARLE